MTETTLDKSSTTAAGDGDELDEQLAAQLVEHARAQGTSLAGPDGLLGKLTKLVFETGLEAEMDEHLGYQAHEAAGRLAEQLGRRFVLQPLELGADAVAQRLEMVRRIADEIEGYVVELGTDGRLLTLDDTVEFFSLVLGIPLTAAEKQDLVAFLRAL